MTQSPSSMRCGRVAIIGRANVGKSTLTNALVGQKVSIVSKRPHTTRHRLLGVATSAQGQLALYDTPGLMQQMAHRMHRVMHQATRSALEDMDAAVLVTEVRRWESEDATALSWLQATTVPIVLVVNKIDCLRDKSVLLPSLAQLSQQGHFAAIHPISATKRQGISALVADLLTLMPLGEPLYESTTLTDRSVRFYAAEFVREQLMRQLGDELPYATTVTIEQFATDRQLLRIGAIIWVERESQKAIVIGQGGARIKAIGIKARQTIEHMVGSPVFLQTWVRVRAGWADDEAALKSFGYD